MSIIDYVLKITSKFDSQGFKNLTQNLTSTQQNILKIATMTAPVFASMTNMAVNFGKQLLESSKNLGAYESRFYAITGDQKLANEELEWTFNLARRTATNIHTLTDAYSIFYATARKSLGQENTRLIMQDWAEIARVTHLSGDAFGRVMYAMRELSSKGAIYADDIKRQLGSAVPNAIEHARKAAEDLGITGTDWWEKLQKVAKNNQPLVNKFMIQFTKHAHEALASPEALRESLTKTDSVLQGLSNSWEFLKMSINRSEAFKKLVKLFGEFVIWLDKISQNTELIKQIVIAFATIWIILLAYQLAGLFALVIGNLSTINVMLAGIPILIGLIVMGILQIILHWNKIKKRIDSMPKWLKTILSLIFPIIGSIKVAIELIKIIGESCLFWKHQWDNLSDSTKDLIKLIFRLATPILLIKDAIDYISESWGLWKYKIRDLMEDIASGFKSIVDSDSFKEIRSLFNPILGGLPLDSIKNKTEETVVKKTETKSRLDIFVNGQNIVQASKELVIGALTQNPLLINKAIIQALTPSR